MPRQKTFNKKSFKGNQHSMKKNVPSTPVTPVTSPPMSTPNSSVKSPPSASKKKLSLVNEIPGHESDLLPCGNIIVQLDILSALVQKSSKCVDCGSANSLNVSEDCASRIGLASKLVIKCSKCEMEKSAMTSSVGVNRYHNVNVRLVYGLRCIGKGAKAGKVLCSVMGLPLPITKFDRYHDVLLNALSDVATGSVRAAAAQETAKNEEKTEIAAAFDGTWQKRGHTSLNGVVSCTGVNTGKVLDVECLSKFCVKCKSNKQSDHKCTKYYDGSSGGMEVQGVTEIFQRSDRTRGVKYTKYLGDGDSKGFSRVCEMAPYGKDLKIEKLECVGHVQKRLGTRLRKLRKDSNDKLSDGKRLKGKGRLTDKEIDNLQLYYGLAIRRNSGNLEAMKKAVWATYFHKLSTDEKPQHALCPSGLDSWCGFQKAKAGGPPYTHKNSLPEAVLENIKQIYRDLSQESLLKKCLHGGTQNTNEALNNLILERAPKSVFVGLKTLKIATYDAVLCYNEGALGRKAVLERMGIKPGNNTVTGLHLLDELRVKEAEKVSQASSKEGRIAARNKKRQRDEEEAAADDLYSPGQF